MFDRREHLIESLRLLANFTGEASKDHFERVAAAYKLTKSFAQSYLVYRFKFPDLNELDDEPDAIDNLFDRVRDITDDFPGPVEWLQKDYKTSKFWKEVRQLATESVAILEALPKAKRKKRLTALALPVKHYKRNRVDNPPTPEEEEEDSDGISPNAVNWAHLRDELRDAMGKHGLVGPDEPADNPHFFLADDRYNEERYHYIEVYDADAFTLEWLRDVRDTLKEFTGWGVAIKNLRGGYVLVFADKLMVNGPPFRACKDAASVLEAAKELV